MAIFVRTTSALSTLLACISTTRIRVTTMIHVPKSTRVSSERVRARPSVDALAAQTTSIVMTPTPARTTSVRRTPLARISPTTLRAMMGYSAQRAKSVRPARAAAGRPQIAAGWTIRAISASATNRLTCARRSRPTKGSPATTAPSAMVLKRASPVFARTNWIHASIFRTVTR